MFSLKDRGHEEYLVLLPGWGFDGRIFETLDLPYNYLLCNHIESDTVHELHPTLSKNGIHTFSIFGFSQGAFTACEICSLMKDRVKRVILAGARPFYPEKELDEVRSRLKADPRTYMNRFYRECFTRGERTQLKWFKENLQKEYLEKSCEEVLARGLDLLGSSRMDGSSLLNIEYIDFVHGREDRIAPFSEIIDFASAVPQSRMVPFDNTGHLSFLNKEFKERIHDR